MFNLIKIKSHFRSTIVYIIPGNDRKQEVKLEKRLGLAEVNFGDPKHFLQT